MTKLTNRTFACYYNIEFAGTVGSCENIAEYASMGYQFVNVISDVTTLSKEFISTLEKSRSALNQK